MSLEAVNATFALLQIDWIAWKIPMVDTIAIGMKVQPFLADGCGGKNEGAEWRIEGIPHAAEARDGAFSSR